MITIHKYTLGRVQNDQVIHMPEGAEVLTVAAQRNDAVVWARVDTLKGFTRRVFRLIGTGHDASAEVGELRYISTFMVDEGTIVVHAFEVIDAEP